MLEEGTDQEGRQFTDKIMKAFISELQSSKQISRLFDIGLSFKDSLDAKDILINHNSDNIQQTIEDFGWSGSINGDKNDFIYGIEDEIEKEDLKRSISLISKQVESGEKYKRLKVMIDKIIQENKYSMVSLNKVFDGYFAIKAKDRFGSDGTEPNSQSQSAAGK